MPWIHDGFFGQRKDLPQRLFHEARARPFEVITADAMAEKAVAREENPLLLQIKADASARMERGRDDFDEIGPELDFVFVFQWVRKQPFNRQRIIEKLDGSVEIRVG